MALHIAVPEFSSKTSTKDAIISTLSEDWPLELKTIYRKLISNYGLNVSVQAVHKMLNHLEEKGIVLRSGKSFALSKNWIKETKEFLDDLSERYNQESGKQIKLKEKGITTLYFNDLSRFSVAMAELLAGNELVGKSRKTDLVGIIRHGWCPLDFKFTDFKLLLKMSKNILKIRGVIVNDTPFDLWIAKQYLKAGWEKVVILGKDIGLKNDLLVQGDSVIQVSFSKKTNETLDAVYQRIHNLSDLFKEWTKLKTRKLETNIEVEIQHNPDLAKMIRNQIESYFEKEKVKA